MCYSALCMTDFNALARDHGAVIDTVSFETVIASESGARRPRVPRAVERNFEGSTSEHGRSVARLIEDGWRRRVEAWELALFTQTQRLSAAERALSGGKATKWAQEEKRIASAKMEQLQGWIQDANRQETESRDSRIYPGYYAPLMVWENGRRVIKAMRYQCRIHGWTSQVERVYPSAFNARRDKLERSWSKHFGIKHGILVVSRFYEFVSRLRLDGNEMNVELEFAPRPDRAMLVACLWSDWSAPDEPPLLSFAAVTDEPPPEVLAAGHDRCIVPVKAEYVDEWLQPRGDLPRMYAILDDRERPFYEHKAAA